MKAKTAGRLPGRAAVAAAALWLVGAALAGATGILSLTHSQGGYRVIYGLVAVGLVVLAVATCRGVRAAETVTEVLLGSQIVGVVGAAWELAMGDTGGTKARHLEDLGIDFRLGLIVNLIYSALASTLFVWVWRDRRGRRGASGRAVSRRS